jgi:hypothetical protein
MVIFFFNFSLALMASNGLTKRKSHRLLSQCQRLELAQSFPPIHASQGEEMALRIQKKEGSESASHPCLSTFLSYRRCVAQFSSSYVSKCAVAANRYRECLETKGDWEPAVGASYVKLLQSMGVFHRGKKPNTITKLGAGSVVRFGN